MKNALIVSVSSSLVIGGSGYGLYRYNKHMDAAFCGILFELWENGKTPQDENVKELEQYQNSGFVNVVMNPPPFDAFEKFKNRDPNEYSMQCLEKSKQNIMKNLEKIQ